MIRLVVVEDDPRGLASLRLLFSSGEGIRLIGAYGSAEDALRAVDWKAVDVLLTDLDLPGLTGAQLIAVARGHAPDLLALAHTVHEQRESLFEALRAGATGYLVKGTTAPVLLEAIRSIVGGETPISPVVAGHLITYFHTAEASSPDWDEALTSRELEVLRLFIRGGTYDEIARSMGLSRHTVHSHVRNVYGKLHVNSRKQALRQALARGYIRA
jgi:DNA-binding NarL/FixJ family response regulator